MHTCVHAYYSLISGSRDEMDKLDDMFIKGEYTLSFGVQSEPVSKTHPMSDTTNNKKPGKMTKIQASSKLHVQYIHCTCKQCIQYV